jgi:hypothetical protein
VVGGDYGKQLFHHFVQIAFTSAMLKKTDDRGSVKQNPSQLHSRKRPVVVVTLCLAINSSPLARGLMDPLIINQNVCRVVCSIFHCVRDEENRQVRVSGNFCFEDAAVSPLQETLLLLDSSEGYVCLMVRE